MAEPVFGVTCGLTDVFEVQNRDPPASGSGPILFDVRPQKNCSPLLEQLDAAEQCKYAKKTAKKRLLERVRAPNSASFQTSSQMVQRECHSHGVHWTAATGRTLLSATSVVRRLRTDEIMGVPKVARTDSVVPQILFG